MSETYSNPPSDLSTPSATAPVGPRSDVRDMLRRERRRRWIRRAVWLVLLPALAVAGWRLYDRLNPPLPPPSYRTAEVERGDIRITVSATGTLEPVRVVDVGPEISGRVVEVSADVNERVTLGQVLVRLDDEPLLAKKEQALAQLESAEATVRQASATRTEARQTEKRVKKLRTQGVQAVVEQEAATAARARADAALAAAKAQRRLAEAQLQSVQTDLDKCEIHAPVDGVVLTRTVELGTAVVASLQAPVLFTIAENLDRMRLRLAVDEADVGRVKAGQKATFTVDAFADRTFEAEVVRVHLASTSDGSVVTYETELAVDNSEGLIRPGMTATASIVSDTVPDKLLVPNAALRFTPPTTPAEEPTAAPSNPFMPMRPSGGSPKKATSSEGSGASGQAGARSPQVVTGGGAAGGGAAGGGATGGQGVLGVVWILRDGEPTEVPVRTLATDGQRTAIEAEGIPVGAEVLVGVRASRGGQ